MRRQRRGHAYPIVSRKNVGMRNLETSRAVKSSIPPYIFWNEAQISPRANTSELPAMRHDRAKIKSP